MSRKLLVLLVLVAGFGPASLHAQGEHKNKVLSKITAAGPTHGEFTGVVQSLDLKNDVLSVNAVHEDDIEIFPVKKNVHVSTADGRKIKLSSLAAGTTVLVSYEQKGDRRTVKLIQVLSSPGERAKKATPPS